METPLDDPLNATENAILQALRLIKDQYLSDQFDTLQLSGRDKNRQYFSEEITPDMIREAGVVANWFFNGHADKLTVDVSRYSTADGGPRRSTVGVRVQWDVSF